MLENWRHGHLYAVSPAADPLAHPPEPYLCCETRVGWRFLYSPHLVTNGPHETDDETLNLAMSQGFGLDPADIISDWEGRNDAIVQIAQSYGILPSDGPLADAEAVIRATTAEGRIIETLQNHTGWPTSTLHVQRSRTGAFQSATFILRTTNKLIARSMLILLGADSEDIDEMTEVQ